MYPTKQGVTVAKSGPKKQQESPVIRRIIERWEGGQWTLMREQRPTDFDERGNLVGSLRLLGPIRTVTVCEE